MTENGQSMTEAELRTMLEAYFAEYGQPAPRLIVRDNLLEAQETQDGFMPFRRNGRPWRGSGLELGSASLLDGVITVNRFTADVEKMGEKAARYQAELDRFGRRAQLKNIIFHESRHILTHNKIGNDLYRCTASQYVELMHENEKSSFREAAFRELVEYKRTRDAEVISEENKFLLNMEGVDFSTAVLTEKEIAAVTKGIDQLYNESKLGGYESNVVNMLILDWKQKRAELGIAAFDEKAYLKTKDVYRTHTLEGRQFNVSAYQKENRSEELMTYIANYRPEIELSEGEKIKFSNLPPQEIDYSRSGFVSQTILTVPGAEVGKLLDKDSSYKKYDFPSYLNEINMAIGYHVPIVSAIRSYQEKYQEIALHNYEVDMRNAGLKKFLQNDKSYQTDFQQRKEKLSAEEAYDLMRRLKIRNTTAELLNARANGRDDLLRDVDPDMKSLIDRVCPSLFNDKGEATSVFKIEEFNNMQKEIEKRFDAMFPTFDKEMKDFYQKNYGVSDNVQELSSRMQNGHNRLEEMRNRLAKGHTEERMAMYRQFRQTDQAEKIRSLRCSRATSQQVVRPSAVRAEVLRSALAEWQKA